MISLWIATALIAAGAAALVVERARATARAAAGPDPALAVYRRQLAEIDELAARGLLAEGERKAAAAETGRRLLAAADAAAPVAKGRLGPGTLVLIAAVAPLAAAVIYASVGSPGAADQPFAARLAGWRQHPERAAPPELAAALRAVAAERPKDAEPLQRLAVLSFSQGDLDGAVSALRKADAIAPGRTEILEPLGEILVLQADGVETPQAAAIFRQALKLDPKSAAARYHLARGRVAAGDAGGGLAGWRVLLGDLAANDPRRASLEADIAAVAATGRLPTPPGAAPTQDVSAAIRGMVDGLAARLKAEPDDAAGWVRLVRAYTVLGETAKRDAALAEARRRYPADAAVLRSLDAALAAPRSAR